MEYKNESCPCKRTKCERHGDCSACKSHHHASKKIPLATCERLENKKTKNGQRKLQTDN